MVQAPYSHHLLFLCDFRNRTVDHSQIRKKLKILIEKLTLNLSYTLLASTSNRLFLADIDAECEHYISSCRKSLLVTVHTCSYLGGLESNKDFRIVLGILVITGGGR